jgi:hypothetical protein
VLPFTAAQFFDVFARYNEAVWPAPLVAYGLGAIAVAAAFRGDRPGNLVTAAVLTLFGGSGVTYHWLAFAKINRAAWLFGTLYLGEATLLFWYGVWHGRLHFAFRRGVTGATAIVLNVYAAVVYPVLGMAFGHFYPAAPMFGVTPCPVTIFTLGLLLMTRTRPSSLMIVPVLWSLIGGTVAFLLQVPQDWLLLVSGPLATALLWKTERAA